MAKHMAPKGHRMPLALVATLLVALGVVVACVLVFARRTSVQPQQAKEHEVMQDESTEQITNDHVTEPEPASELARMFQQGEVHSIRLVGDSITAGFATDGYADGDLTHEGVIVYDDGAGTVHYESGHDARCWANELRAYAAERGVTDVVNAGINGEFMSTLAQYPDAWLGNGADVVFVALGTNDAGYYGSQEYRAYAEVALAAVASRCKLLVVLSPVSDLRPEWQVVQPAADLAGVLQELCDAHGYVLVNMSDAVTPEQFNADGLHPTSDGSLAMWQHIKTTLGL